MRAEDLFTQDDRMKADRANYEAVWREINDYVWPRKGVALSGITPGTKQTRKLYDSTAIKANRDLGTWMNQNLTSMSMEWFSLRLAQRGEQTDKEVEEWLEDCRHRLYDALGASNFVGESQKVYLDLPSYCIGCLYMDEKSVEKPGFNGFNFEAFSPGEYCIQLEGNRTVALSRDLEISAQECFDRWGEASGKKIVDMVKAKPLEKVKLLHSVFPRKWFGGQHKTPKPFVSYYAVVDGKQIIDEGGYDEFPFFAVPWDRSSRETYGSGCGWDSLPDVKTLNAAKRMGLQQWGMAIRPPLGVLDDGVIGNVQLIPGGITVFRKMDAFKELVTQARFDVGRLKEEDLIRSIQGIFYADLIRFVPPVDESRQMTAYEVSKRYELQLLLGPTFGNLVFHWFDPMIERGFNMMLRAGALPPMPRKFVELSQRGRDQVKIEYESPLAKALRAHEVAAITNTMTVVGPMAEVKADIFDNFDLDEAAQHIARVNGIPAKIMRAKEGKNSVKEIREARAKEQMRRSQLEEAAAAAEVASKATPALKAIGPGGAQALSRMAGGGNA